MAYAGAIMLVILGILRAHQRLTVIRDSWRPWFRA